MITGRKKFFNQTPSSIIGIEYHLLSDRMKICLRTIYFNQLPSGSSIITISTIRIVYSATH